MCDLFVLAIFCAMRNNYYFFKWLSLRGIKSEFSLQCMLGSIQETSHLLHYLGVRHTVLLTCIININFIQIIICCELSILLYFSPAHPLSCKRSKKALNCLKVASTASSICSSPNEHNFTAQIDHKFVVPRMACMLKKLTR